MMMAVVEVEEGAAVAMVVGGVAAGGQLVGEAAALLRIRAACAPPLPLQAFLKVPREEEGGGGEKTPLIPPPPLVLLTANMEGVRFVGRPLNKLLLQ